MSTDLVLVCQNDRPLELVLTFNVDPAEGPVQDVQLFFSPLMAGEPALQSPIQWNQQKTQALVTLDARPLANEQFFKHYATYRRQKGGALVSTRAVDEQAWVTRTVCNSNRAPGSATAAPTHTGSGAGAAVATAAAAVVPKLMKHHTLRNAAAVGYAAGVASSLLSFLFLLCCLQCLRRRRRRRFALHEEEYYDRKNDDDETHEFIVRPPPRKVKQPRPSATLASMNKYFRRQPQQPVVVNGNDNEDERDTMQDVIV